MKRPWVLKTVCMNTREVRDFLRRIGHTRVRLPTEHRPRYLHQIAVGVWEIKKAPNAHYLVTPICTTRPLGLVHAREEERETEGESGRAEIGQDPARSPTGR